MVIYVHDSVPYLKGEDQVTTNKGDMEYCSTELFPNYNYQQSMLVVGAYRPPKSKRLLYKQALERVLTKNRKQGATALIAGELNITSWDTEYMEWILDEELWVLANRTHRSGPGDRSGPVDRSWRTEWNGSS